MENNSIVNNVETPDKNKESTFKKVRFIYILLIIGYIYGEIYFTAEYYSTNKFFIEVISKILTLVIIFLLFYFTKIVNFKTLFSKIKSLYSFTDKKYHYKTIFIIFIISIGVFGFIKSLENIFNIYLKTNIIFTNDWYLKNWDIKIVNNIPLNIFFNIFFIPIFIEFIFKVVMTKSFMVKYTLKRAFIYIIFLLWFFYIYNDLNLFT